MNKQNKRETDSQIKRIADDCPRGEGNWEWGTQIKN